MRSSTSHHPVPTPVVRLALRIAIVTTIALALLTGVWMIGHLIIRRFEAATG